MKSIVVEQKASLSIHPDYTNTAGLHTAVKGIDYQLHEAKLCPREETEGETSTVNIEIKSKIISVHFRNKNLCMNCSRFDEWGETHFFSR